MIDRLLAPLAAALVLASAASAQEVRLSVDIGRAVLVTDHGVSPLTRGRRVPALTGPGHFELAPGSRASLRWAGRCSLELRGPVSVSWQPATDEAGLQLDFSAVREADLEVRSGVVRVGLPGAWRAQVTEGACSLYGLPAGGVELVHHAGREVRATWVGGEGFAPPPVQVHAGERARLRGEPEFSVRGDASGSAPGWGASTWPWGEGGIPGQPDLALRQAPGWAPESPWPWPASEDETEPWKRWDWPWQAPEEPGDADGPTAPGEPGDADGPTAPGEPGDADGPTAPGEPGDADGPAAPGSGPATGSDPATPDATLQDEATPTLPDAPEGAPEAAVAPPGNARSRGNEPPPWGDWAWPWETRTPEPSALAEAPVDRDPVAGADPGPEPAAEPDAGPPVTADAHGVAPEEPGAARRPVRPVPPRPSAPQDGAGTPLPDDPDRAAVAEGPVEDVPELPAHLRWDDPADRPQPPPQAFEAEHWRGLPEGTIEFHSRFAIQIGPPFEVRALGNGTRELWLPPTSSEPLWYFSPNLDLRLFPGASLVLEEDGSIRYHRGTVRILTADPARRF